MVAVFCRLICQAEFYPICTLADDRAAGRFWQLFTGLLQRFLHSLHDSGRAELAPEGRDLYSAVRNAGQQADERRKIGEILEDWHAEAVMDLPGPPLAFHAEASLWGAVLLFRAACLVCFRDIGDAEIHDLFQQRRMPDAKNPAAHFSADLCLRHWPGLYRMARARSEDDLLVKMMHELAVGFPLSSVGMNLKVSLSESLPCHAGLRQICAERALERADHAMLAVPEINALVRSKLGNYTATLGRGLLTPTLES